MSRTFNFDTEQDAIEFKIGDVTLTYLPSDDEVKELVEKATAFEERAKEISETNDAWEASSEVKTLLDDFFAAMFDEKTPEKLYKAVHKRTTTYTKLFFYIAATLKEVSEEQQNDEYFKQFLSE